ncbi:T9SS type A sorting domain-containing protein [Niastella caeni]|uniref:T9SS type A sorting domain-containing protein n=1 Tax=Niastella caeni TaxID=2569763 RepID=A0A4S8I2N0_9BACT|nr:metallophosphoesterase [Niastella caeni]THU40162.1 T9SS type A sorting domain-containing protein [Niastella caeni]
MTKIIYTIALLFCVVSVLAQTALVPTGSTWKYLDNGSNQGTAWRTASFNDGSWASGAAQLGYGDGDEATVVSYGPQSNNKYTTTYFRKTISVADASIFSNYTLRVKRDDGIVVYINGVEKYRNNMPSGTIAYNTWASTNCSDDGNTWLSTTLAAGSLVTGTNVIAVEIHQINKTSSDVSFDLELTGTGVSTAVLTRGPYLQMGNQTAVTLRWRTNIATNSKIEAGTIHGSYTLTATDPASTTEHEVRITGLTPDTKYYYRFGSTTQIIQAGTDNFFTTAPADTTTRKIRIAAFGDCGRNDNSFQTGTLNSYRNYAGSNPAEVLLLLGDNAYNNGTDAEYQSNFFNAYSATILKNHQLFPAPGNHDYYGTSQTSRTGAYYQNFTMPTAAQCGGVASGTEAFYSWDWGNIHFLSLDSYGKENAGTTRLYDTTGAQVTWVKQDLTANTKKWTVVYWHHPPYTMGSHNSDTESELINIRQNFIRILERYGVDIIICGHSHDYERSYLLNGYYGNESSFNVSAHTISSSSGKYDGSTNSCPYKPANGANHGTVYVLAGSAGADGGVQSGYPHNAMPFSVDDGGMFYFEIENNRLDAKFIRRTGIISDQFTMMKDVNKTTNVSIISGSSTTLTASWPSGTYTWSTGATTRSITVSPAANTTYTVRDNASATCVTDVFNVTVNSGARVQTDVPVAAAYTLKIQPTFVKKGQSINVQTNSGEKTTIAIVDISGRIVKTVQFAGAALIETHGLQAGTYFIKVKDNKTAATQKIVVTE